MISVYLTIVEQELDQLILDRKKTSDRLHVNQELYAAIEKKSDQNDALEIILLYNIIKFQFDLDVLDKKIESASNTIKELHQIRINTKKERHERNSEESEF